MSIAVLSSKSVTGISSENSPSCASSTGAGEDRRLLPFHDPRERPSVGPHPRRTVPPVLPGHGRRRQESSLCGLGEGSAACGRAIPRTAPPAERNARRCLLRPAPVRGEPDLLRGEVPDDSRAGRCLPPLPKPYHLDRLKLLLPYVGDTPMELLDLRVRRSACENA